MGGLWAERKPPAEEGFLVNRQCMFGKVDYGSV